MPLLVLFWSRLVRLPLVRVLVLILTLLGLLVWLLFEGTLCLRGSFGGSLGGKAGMALLILSIAN